MYQTQGNKRTTLRHLDNDDSYEAVFESSNIPDYILDLIPKKYREDITGAVYQIIDGDIGEVWLTEDSRPYDLGADYRTPEYYVEDAKCHICKTVNKHPAYCPFYKR